MRNLNYSIVHVQYALEGVRHVSVRVRVRVGVMASELGRVRGRVMGLGECVFVNLLKFRHRRV